MAQFSQKGRPDDRPSPPESLLTAWKRITARFRREPDCMEELFRGAYKAGVIECPRCGHKKVNKSYGQRLVRCKRCGKQWSFTARTFFHRIRRAQPWLGAILLLEDGVDVNSSQFQELAEIAYSTAWTTFQKIAAAISNVMDSNEGTSSIFSELFGKRSRETPARRSPIAEQEEIDKLADDDNAGSSGQANPTDSCADATDHRKGTERPNLECEPSTVSTSKDLVAVVTGHEEVVYELLSAEPIHFDVIQARTGMSTGALSATLTLLEMDSVVVHMPGDWYVRAAVNQRNDKSGHHSSSQTAETATEIDGILYVLRRTYHAVSRKYLQAYLARYWCTKDRARWSRGAVMRTCLEFGPITYSAILNYVSPPIVKVFAGT